MLSKKTIQLFLPFLSLLLLFSSCLPSMETAPYEEGLEMWEEPMHKLVFTKDNIKVMDVVIPGGDTCQFHIHRHPTIYVLLNGAKYATQNWGMEWQHVRLMDLAWAGMVQDMSETYTTSTPNVKHRVFIPDDEDYHLIAILNTGKGKENIKKANGSVNNLWFRENRFEVAANQQSKPIKLDFPSILVQYTEGITSIFETGASSSITSKKGSYSYHAANKAFQISNESSEKQEFVTIEVK